MTETTTISREKKSMGCFIAFISIFYLVGFGMLGYGLYSMQRSTAAGSWPITAGTLQKVKLEENRDSEGDTYRVDVKYSYKVAGKEYDGDCLAFGYTASSGREIHEQIQQKLQAVKTLDVRYDPSDPAISCLSYGIHRSIQFTLAFAVTWLAFVVGFTLIAWVASLEDTVLLNNLSIR